MTYIICFGDCIYFYISDNPSREQTKYKQHFHIKTCRESVVGCFLDNHLLCVMGRNDVHSKTFLSMMPCTDPINFVFIATQLF